MRLHFASLIALAASAQAAYIPITPRSEARHLANQAMGQAGEARAFHAHHVMPRSHNGAGLRKVRRLKRGRTCKPRPSSGSAYASPTATPTSHSTLVDTGKDHHKSKTKSKGGDDGDEEWNSSSKTDGGDSWMSTTEEGSAKSTASSTGDEWSHSASASATDGGDWSASAAGSSSSANASETGSGGGNSNNSSNSGGNNNQTPGNSDGGLFPVEGIKLFTTAKNSGGSTPGFQLNGEMPSEDYDPKTCKY